MSNEGNNANANVSVILNKSIELYRVSKNREILRNNELIALRKSQRSELEKFEDIKSDYISDAEYFMVLEKFNLKLAKKQSSIDKTMHYRERIKAFYNYVTSLVDGDDISIQRNFTNLIESIKTEILSSYKNDITIIKQKKVMYNRENRYLNVIKDVNPQEYEERKKNFPTALEMDELITKQYDTEEEKKNVETYLKKDKYNFDSSMISKMVLLDESVFTVANSIFPELDAVRFGRESVSTENVI